MTLEHVIFIPGIMLVGMVIGFVMGSNAAKKELAARREKMKK